MSETRWTAGPWQVNEPNGKGNGFRIDGPSDWPRIPEAWLGFQVTSKEQIANAHLIAAAPDLYAALAQCLALAELKYGNMDDVASHVFGECRAALAKARGEGEQ